MQNLNNWLTQGNSRLKVTQAVHGFEVTQAKKQGTVLKDGYDIFVTVALTGTLTCNYILSINSVSGLHNAVRCGQVQCEEVNKC